MPDATILPQIAALYCVTIDDLYKETSIAYDNYAQRLGSVFEASLKPEDFLRADMEYRKLLKSGEYTSEDLRLYGILYQYMMRVCIRKVGEIFDRVIKKGSEEDPEVYWATRRQKEVFLWEIGRNQESIEEFHPLIEEGSNELQEWICLIQAYTLCEDFDAALECAKKAEARFQESATLHTYIENLMQSVKYYDEAFLHWERALELEPEWYDAAYSMSSCYEKLGNYTKAYEIYNQIAENLERRGFDAEVSWSRSRARMCHEKMLT